MAERSQKPAYMLALADDDIVAAINWYQGESTEVAQRFIDKVEQAVRAIRHAPTAGSLRYAQQLGIPDLRFKPCQGFPNLVFYVDHVDRIDIWRVLHSKRDIPVQLTDDMID